jgi:hypothetical protein
MFLVSGGGATIIFQACLEEALPGSTLSNKTHFPRRTSCSSVVRGAMRSVEGRLRKNQPEAWCLRTDSNRHGDKPQGILSPLCLPIPPLRPQFIHTKFPFVMQQVKRKTLNEMYVIGVAGRSVPRLINASPYTPLRE